MGSNLAACFAGKTPKNKPIAPETPEEIAIAATEIPVSKEVKAAKINTPLTPIPIPTNPPATDKITDSIIN